MLTWLRRWWRESKPEPSPMAIAIPHDSPNAAAAVVDFLDRNCPPGARVLWLCIGTDDCMGDALGPYVGTLLSRMDIPDVYGTLAAPVNAETVETVSRSLPAAAYVVAIDAMISERFPPGTLLLNPQALRPGEGVNATLSPVGHAHIAGIVTDHRDGLVRCPMGRIVTMAEVLADAVRQWRRRR